MRAIDWPLATRLRCRSATPLGLPVVPEVYSTTAIASASEFSTGGGVAPSAKASSTSSVNSGGDGTLANSSRVAHSPRAPECARM